MQADCGSWSVNERIAYRNTPSCDHDCLSFLFEMEMLDNHIGNRNGNLWDFHGKSGIHGISCLLMLYTISGSIEDFSSVGGFF